MFWHRSLVQIATIAGIALFTGSVAIAKIESTRSFYPVSNISRDRTILAKENQKRIALIIGNSNYNKQGKLLNPINDADDMSKALAELGFEIIKVVDADKQAMDAALEKFAVQLNQGGVGLFYYAGHGIQVDGENYLIPVDAVLNSEKDVNYESLPMGKIQNAMEEAKTEVNIIIVDACRSNPFGRRWTRNTQNQGLAPIQALTGSFIAFATAPGNSAEDGTGTNGTFTSYILKYIQTPNLSIEELFKKVRQGVSNETEKRQIPWDSSSLIGDFSFNIQPKNTVENSSALQPTNTPTPLPSDSETKVDRNENEKPTTIVINTPTSQPTNIPTSLPSDSEIKINPNGNHNLSRTSSVWAEIIAKAPEDSKAQKTYFNNEIKTYLERGGDPNAITGNGWTVIHYAAWNGNKEMVELLFAKGADINAKTSNGDTVFHYGVYSGNKELVAFLLTKGADINAMTNYGYTSLYYAVMSENKDMVEFLLNKGADVNADNIKFTSLHYAAYSGNKKIVDLLIAKGININAKDDTGKTPLDLALENKRTEIVQILKKRGAVSSNGSQ